MGCVLWLRIWTCCFHDGKAALELHIFPTSGFFLLELYLFSATSRKIQNQAAFFHQSPNPTFSTLPVGVFFVPYPWIFRHEKRVTESTSEPQPSMDVQVWRLSTGPRATNSCHCKQNSKSHWFDNSSKSLIVVNAKLLWVAFYHPSCFEPSNIARQRVSVRGLKCAFLRGGKN